MVSVGKRRGAPLIIFLAAVLSLLWFTPAATAHQGEQHQKAQSEEQAPADHQNMPGMEAPGAEMTWPTEVPGGMGMRHEKPKTFTGRVVAWLGAWHPAVIHFPIALLLTVAFLEAAAAALRNPLYNASNKILLAVGTVGAFVAAPLGWASAGLPAAADEWFLTAHRWIGTAIPLLMLLLWRLKPRADLAALKPSSRLYEGLLIVSVLTILAQAYLGAEITHGEGHLAF